MISQKCQYALRALFELAKDREEGPVRIHDIAQAQDIPERFLENILHQLKLGGFVDARRGRAGGYVLARTPGDISVADIIEYIEGRIAQVDCTCDGGSSNCRFRGDCAFLPMWQRATEALREVYADTTLEKLVREEKERMARQAPDYSI